MWQNQPAVRSLTAAAPVKLRRRALHFSEHVCPSMQPCRCLPCSPLFFLQMRMWPSNAMAWRQGKVIQVSSALRKPCNGFLTFPGAMFTSQVLGEMPLETSWELLPSVSLSGQKQ